MKLADQTNRFCKKNKLLNRGETVIIGVSGGKDSVALFHILLRLRDEYGLSLVVAHFNHKLRRAAGKDARFVKALAQRYNIPCYTKTTRRKKKPTKASLEEVARKERFAFFVRLAKKLSADSVALAHTKDDLAETVLMRLIRGGGLKGLPSILPKRRIDGVTFIRPLLDARTDQVLTFLKQHHFTYCQDETNRQKTFFRNKIRLELLPLLEKDYNRNIKEVLVRLSRNVTLDYDYIHRQAHNSYAQVKKTLSKGRIVLETPKFIKRHTAIQRLIIRSAIEELKGDTRRLTFAHIEEVLDLVHNRPTGSIVHLPSRMTVTKTNKNIKLYISKS